MITAGLNHNGILGRSDISAKIFDANTITVDMFGNVCYRNFPYKMVTHARVFSLKAKTFDLTDHTGLFIAGCFSYINQMFGFDNMCTWEKIRDKKIKLPVKKDGTIHFAFMEDFVKELEAERITELGAYLKTNGLDNYVLTKEEQCALDHYSKLDWEIFNLEELFGKSTRGRRLKSADRIPGRLPFVTAGEAKEGVSDFIGNDVQVFSKNTITIDMFGSAKYRNYEYGGDDHVAVVHTENLPMDAAIFVTSAIHKVAHNGQFNYGKNFYAKDADALDMKLPVVNGEPDYGKMALIISAIRKMVMKDIVLLSNTQWKVEENADKE